MLMLSATVVASLFDMTDAFAAVEEAARLHTMGHTSGPPRSALSATASHGEFLVMPSVIDGEVFGTKTWFTFPHAAGEIPATAAFVVLVDPTTGREVMMDGSAITDMRTGAMTGIAARSLAPRSSSVIGMVGAGIQARTQALALVHALPDVTEIRVTSRDEARRSAFAERLRADLARDHGDREIDVVALSGPQEAVADAHVVVLATTASHPVVEDAWLGGDVLVCGVGSHDRESREIDPATVARASVVAVDTLVGGVDGALDLAGPVEDGTLDRGDVLELGDLVGGVRTLPDSGVRVFKSVGFAAADVVSARRVLANATRVGAGTEFDLHR